MSYSFIHRGGHIEVVDGSVKIYAQNCLQAPAE